MTNTTTTPANGNISPAYGMRKVKKLFLTGIFKGMMMESTAHQSLPVGHEYIECGTGNMVRIIEILP